MFYTPTTNCCISLRLLVPCQALIKLFTNLSQIFHIITNPTTCSFTKAVKAAWPSQSSSWKGSSMETIGYSPM